jgi:hypothetical protein
MSLALTRTDLIAYLRMRLNDVLIGSNTAGNYTSTELGFCIDLAYRESVVATDANKITSTVALTAGTPTYDLNTIYEPLEISHNGKFLEKVELGDMGVKLQTWNATANGTPTHWMHLTGGYIRIYPTPDTTAANVSLTVHGYAYPTDMGASDTPVALQDGFAISCLLDRAEAEARFMRPDHGSNAQIGTLRMANWQEWVKMIRSAIRGEK